MRGRKPPHFFVIAEPMPPRSTYEDLMDDVDARVAAGDAGDAIARLEVELQRTPDHFSGWVLLGRLLYEAGRFSHALAAVRTAEQLDPLTGQFQQIQTAMQGRDVNRAQRIADAMLHEHPGHPRAIFTLAHLAQGQGDFEAAIDHLDDGLQISPANIVLRSMQISALEQAGRYREAIAGAREVVRIEPDFNASWGLITLLLRYGQNEEALAAIDEAERLVGADRAKTSALHLVRGQVLRVLGRRDDSIAALRASLDLNAMNATAWWALADLKTYRFSPEDTQAIKTLLARPGSNAREQSLAAFALAKAQESAGDGHGAMAAYHRANQLYPSDAFNPDAFDAAVERIIEAMTPDALRVRAKTAPDAPRPVFIVGLPRSGSTLVEQILASHSLVEGTMEQPTLPAIKRRAHLICARRLGGEYLAKVGLLSQADLTELGQSYLSESELFRPSGAEVFTDKLPHNFEHVGLIHKILPHAVIIDVRRNPMDCGYSLYKQHFTQGADFSYTLENIGQYYNGYLKIMDHWDAVLPGRVFHLQYEDLLEDPDAQIRALLDHVGVAFEEACLDFHKTRRAVRTASSEQVRQPLYTSSIGAWRHVERELEPLKSALGDETLSRFQDHL
jgi:cytochrome c-type biogenesis protein CcmH/NrfG